MADENATSDLLAFTQDPGVTEFNGVTVPVLPGPASENQTKPDIAVVLVNIGRPGALKNGNRPGDPNRAPRCGAKARTRTAKTVQ